MKKYALISALGIAAGMVSGCRESLPPHFDDIQGVYFYNFAANNSLTDRSVVTFVYEDADEMEVPVRVQLVGRASDHDRLLNLKVTSRDAVAGVDYRVADEVFLPAGKTAVDIMVKLTRTLSLKQDIRTVDLELFENEHFILPFDHHVVSGGGHVSATRFTIEFSDQFTAPPEGWRDIFVGSFSQRKFELICKVMEMSRADFNVKGQISDAKWMFIKNQMTIYVLDQEKLRTDGNPYDADAFDDHGDPLSFERNEK